VNWKRLKEFAGALVTPPLDTHAQAARIDFMEHNVMVPVKFFIIAALYYILYASGAFPGTMPVGNLSIDTLRQVFWAYVAVTVLGAVFLANMHRMPVALVQWVVCLINLLDAVFLAALTVLTGVMKEITYWVFMFLIARNAASVPVTWLQIPLNVLTIIAFVTAGVFDKALVDVRYIRMEEDDPVLRAANTSGYYQAMTLRLLLLMLWTACCYGVQLLFERQRETEDELREHVVRHEQMQTAGRLAAEIAHRIKNPLAIITNTVFSLQRSRKDDHAAQQELHLIREEVDRCDRILTELMGYAQLAEGRIEKLNVIEEVELAIQQVFPRKARFDVRIRREYAPDVPALQMQRGHLRDILTNLLLNAREALNGMGNVRVAVQSDTNYTVTLSVKDDGPGIPGDKLERIFEPYFTSKDKGTGLGLAIVKHNTEIYGGFVAVHSELGKGAEFVVQIPAKTMMRLRR
jgi:signal transduction histidine kinase